MSLQLGPGSPLWGRRPKRHLATVQIEDKVESESEESEPDLGPLRSQEQLRHEENTAESFHKALMDTMGSESTEVNLTDEGVELVLDASRHVARSIVERTRGARGVLLEEMTESMDVTWSRRTDVAFQCFPMDFTGCQLEQLEMAS